MRELPAGERRVSDSKALKRDGLVAGKRAGEKVAWTIGKPACQLRHIWPSMPRSGTKANGPSLEFVVVTGQFWFGTARPGSGFFILAVV
jgi:hypothetical protein